MINCELNDCVKPFTLSMYFFSITKGPLCQRNKVKCLGTNSCVHNLKHQPQEEAPSQGYSILVGHQPHGTY